MQEQKYSAELDKALTEYGDLKTQAADFDPVELYEARQAIRPAQDKAAEQQLEDALQEKPSLIMLLREDAEERAGAADGYAAAGGGALRTGAQYTKTE